MIEIQQIRADVSCATHFATLFFFREFAPSQIASFDSFYATHNSPITNPAATSGIPLNLHPFRGQALLIRRQTTTTMKQPPAQTPAQAPAQAFALAPAPIQAPALAPASTPAFALAPAQIPGPALAPV